MTLNKSMYAKHALDIISAEQSRSKKMELMKEACAVIDGFYEGVQLALDVRVRYNIKTIPPYDKVDFGSPSSLTFRLRQLETLLRGEIKADQIGKFLSNQLSLADTADAAFIALVIMKDLQCGLGRESYADIFPDFVLEMPDTSAETCVSDQLYTLEYPVVVHDVPSGYKVILELGGMRPTVMVTTKNKVLTIPTQILGELEPVIKTAHDIAGGLILDAELVSDVAGVIEKFKRGSASAEELDSIRLRVYDVFSYQHFYLGKNKQPYNNRLPVVEGLFPRTNKYATKVNNVRVDSVFDMRSYVKLRGETNDKFCVRELHNDIYLQLN